MIDMMLKVVIMKESVIDRNSWLSIKPVVRLSGPRTRAKAEVKDLESISVPSPIEIYGSARRFPLDNSVTFISVFSAVALAVSFCKTFKEQAAATDATADLSGWIQPSSRSVKPVPALRVRPITELAAGYAVWQM